MIAPRNLLRRRFRDGGMMKERRVVHFQSVRLSYLSRILEFTLHALCGVSSRRVLLSFALHESCHFSSH